MRIFMLIFAIFSASLSAGIDVQRGNFFLIFNDMDLGNGLKVSRAYNSLGYGGGIFGVKWGSHIETRLYNIAGVMLMIEEVPGGGRHHYLKADKNSFNEVVMSVVSIIEKRNGRFAKGNKEKFIAKLKGDPVLLGEFAKRFNITGDLEVGSKYYAIDKSHEKIVILADGSFVRYNVDGTKEKFNQKGFRVKEEGVGGIVRSYIYDKSDRLLMIKDSQKRWIRFYYAGANVVKIASYTGKIATYKYNNKGHLVFARGTDGLVYKYYYDAEGRMVKAYLPTRQKGLSGWWYMKYDDKGRLVYQKTPSGMETFLKFAQSETDKEKLSYIEVIKRLGARILSNEKYTYVERINNSGAFYTYKVSYTNNKGYKKEIKFAQCCSKPLFTNDNGRVTIYKYDRNKNLIKKILPDGTVISAKYEGYLPKEVKVGSVKYFIRYDKQKRLTFIGTRSLGFSLRYDKLNRIKHIKATDGRWLSYSYIKGTKNISAIKTRYGILKILYDKKEGMVYKPTSGAVKEHFDDILALQQDYLDMAMILAQLETR